MAKVQTWNSFSLLSSYNSCCDIFICSRAFCIVRGYSTGSAMQAPEPGEIIRELLAKKQALQMELRQRAATGSSMYYGSRLAISMLTNRGAVRIALAAGPGLLVIRYNYTECILPRVPFFHRLFFDFLSLNPGPWFESTFSQQKSRTIKIARFRKCKIIFRCIAP